MRSVIGDIINRLTNLEYAKKYGAEMAKLDFALTLTKTRTQYNLTQSELAEKLQTSQPYIAKLEGGEANPTIGTVGSLLAVLGLRLVTSISPLIPEAKLPKEPASEDATTIVIWDANTNAMTSGPIKGTFVCGGNAFQIKSVNYIVDEQNMPPYFRIIGGRVAVGVLAPVRSSVAAGE